MISVSVILPTYNRAKFLPQAFESIRSQQWTDWELIVVDDGSTDETRELIKELSRELPQRVVYIYQENQGAYGARNTGLDHARGRYIAFYDSDDIWLPHHLKDCAEALEKNEDVDWVYGACRTVDIDSDKVLATTTLQENGTPRPFSQLHTRQSETLRIIDDDGALECAALHGLYCGLQTSVIRRIVFDEQRFETRFRNEAEDVLTSIRTMAAGHRFGYFASIHVVYRVHSENSSGAAKNQALEKKVKLYEAMAAAQEHFLTTTSLPAKARRAFDHAFGELVFWRLGYSLLWQGGRRREALVHFRNGLRHRRWDPWMWKTYLLCLARCAALGA